MTEKVWGVAWVGVVMVVGAQEASCKGGKDSEQTPGTPMWDHLGSWEGEEVESWVGVQGSPDEQGAWGRVGALGTG